MQAAHEAIAEKIRSKVIRGEWAPGSRLPNRNDIISEIGSNTKVVQSAIHQLVDEGFLEVGARKLGTRVALNPPHLTRYYLIFPDTPKNWDHFRKALAEAAEALSGETCEFICFYGLGGQRDVADYQKMIADVQNKSVAGLIFTSSAEEFAGTPLLDTPRIPRVAISSGWTLPGVPKVKLDIQDFVCRAVQHLAGQGRKRLALLAPNTGLAETFRQALAEHNLDPNEVFIQYPRPNFKESARSAVQLLLTLPKQSRPDGLIIADDNLIEGAVESLTGKRIPVPDELSLVTMNNFPHIVQTELTVTRFGFDIPALLSLLMKRLEQVSNGEEPEENTRVSVVTEAEFILNLQGRKA
jgi:DNA-binding LacI/PurR family transcriptional regulator